MRLGVALPSYANDGMRVPPGRLTGFATRAEELGFDGVWMTEHLLHPPGREYSRLDPLGTLSAVAGATDSVPLGTCILILPMRDPVLFAKRAATLQHLSGDRLTLGLGIGWVEAEYEAVGVPFEERGPRMDEALSLLDRLFAEETVTFDGEFYSVDEFHLEPPTRRRPPILVAGGQIERDGERFVPGPVTERIAEHADGWLAPPRRPDGLADAWAEIADGLDAAGRDPDTAERTVLNFVHMVPNADGEEARRRQRRAFRGKGDVDRAMETGLTGSVGEIRETVGGYADAGYDELILGPRTHDLREVDRQLELWADELSGFL